MLFMIHSLAAQARVVKSNEVLFHDRSLAVVARRSKQLDVGSGWLPGEALGNWLTSW